MAALALPATQIEVTNASNDIQVDSNGQITTVNFTDADLIGQMYYPEHAVRSRLQQAITTANYTASEVLQVTLPDSVAVVELVPNTSGATSGSVIQYVTDATNTITGAFALPSDLLYNGVSYATTTATSVNDVFRVTTNGNVVSITTNPNYRVTIRPRVLSPEEAVKAAAEQKRQQFLQNIRAQLAPNIRRNRKALDAARNSPAELKARETLQEMLLESEWRRYVTNGFIMVRGPSGKWYQIFSDHYRRIQVYEKGVHTHNLCIHTDGECPPTDHVINMKVRVELDEDSLWKASNVFDMKPRKDQGIIYNDAIFNQNIVVNDAIGVA